MDHMENPRFEPLKEKEAPPPGRVPRHLPVGFRAFFPKGSVREVIVPFAVSAVTASATLFGESRPFGLALIAAAGNTVSAVAATAGSLLGTLSLPSFAGLSVSSLLLLAARLLFGLLFTKRGKKDAPLATVLTPALPIRQGMAAVAALLSGVLILFFRESLSAPALLSVLLSTAAAPLVTAALAAGEQKVSPGAAAAGWVLFFALCRSLSSLGLTFDPGAVAAFALPLVAAYRSGTERPLPARLGTVLPLSLLGGVALSPALLAPFPLSAAVSVLLLPYFPAAAATGAYLAALGAAFAAGGIQGLTALMPELTVSAAILLPLFRFRLIPQKAGVREAGSSTAALLSSARARETENRVESLSAACKDLSGVFAAVAERLSRPGIMELKGICDKAVNARCTDCKNRTLCWEREYATTADTVCRMAAALHKDGRASASLIPKNLAGRCHRMDDILTEVNDECARRMSDARRQDKTDVIGDDYAAFSELLAEAGAGVQAEFAPQNDAAEKLRRALAARGLPPPELAVYGSRRHTVVARFDPAHLTLGSEDLRKLLEDVLEEPMAEPEYALSGASVLLTSESRPRLTVTFGAATRAAGEGSRPASPPVNGDAAAQITTEDGRAIAMITDGMGTGGEAAVTARLSVRFLSEMLSAKVSLTAALRMLNNYLRARRLECSAGIDLFEVDLYTAEACFVKSGAAPSFVVRDGRLFRLLSKTVPVGILRALDAEMIRCALLPGDMVVMLSDGVLSGSHEAPWLLDLLVSPGMQHRPAGEIARRIVSAAATESRDDITAAVIRVEAA